MFEGHEERCAVSHGYPDCNCVMSGYGDSTSNKLYEVPNQLVLLKHLIELVAANEGLSKIKNNKTLYEMSPTLDEECFQAWYRLNNAMREAKKVIG